jgi:hypothetical protein
VRTCSECNLKALAVAVQRKRQLPVALPALEAIGSRGRRRLSRLTGRVREGSQKLEGRISL